MRRRRARGWTGLPLRARAEPPGLAVRFELDIDPAVWFLEDDGYELAVFHSHPTDSARPSRTDIANIGLWAGRPYLILSGQPESSPAGVSSTASRSRLRSLLRDRERPVHEVLVRVALVAVLPGGSVRTTVFFPTNPTFVIFLFMPGPIRWKSCEDDLSLTVIEYLPAVSVFTRLPAGDFNEIVKLGPTVPTSGFAFASATVTPATRAMQSAAATRAGRRILRPG